MLGLTTRETDLQSGTQREPRGYSMAVCILRTAFLLSAAILLAGEGSHRTLVRSRISIPLNHGEHSTRTGR